MADLHTLKDGLVVTAFWEARPDEVDAVQAIVRQFLPQAQREPGVKAFQIHQSTSEPHKFFFYEVFKDEAAFAAASADRSLQDADRGPGGPQARQARAHAAPVRVRILLLPRHTGEGRVGESRRDGLEHFRSEIGEGFCGAFPLPARAFGRHAAKR